LSFVDHRHRSSPTLWAISSNFMANGLRPMHGQFVGQAVQPVRLKSIRFDQIIVLPEYSRRTDRLNSLSYGGVGPGK
jgi:hypothetical protein